MHRISTRARCIAPRVAVLLLCALAGAQAQENSVKANLRLGAEAMHKGKPEEAEKHFRAVTQLAPELADGYLDLGLAQLRQGKLAEAVESLQQALQRNAAAPGASMFLGITYFQMNHLDQARVALQREISLNPENAEALMWLGITELAAGDPEKAVPPLDKAAELSPKDINILDYRGRAHLLISKNSYAQMYAVDPNSWRMHRLSAQIFSASNQHEEAIREYKAAIQLSPKQADLYEELGDEYRKESSLEMAAAAYAKELALTPHNAVAMYNLGSVMVERGKAQEGIPLLKEAISDFGKPTVADYYLGRGLADLAAYPEAADYLERAITVPSQDDEVARRAYYKLSQVYRKLQRSADARNALAQFQKLEEQKADRGAQQITNWKKMNAGAAAEISLPAPSNP